ncbi:hypothetical protein B9Z19DRAFT_1123107 [Tuber borchii]|uniref:SWIM-type domain-containing protein n=1 Tax=Tuber borchii TaxID=42251 RepID=A0A2T6ZZ60_TUBBO|nr:hypothetical protein B9Z19DRAFT_1123107 [Tuber borchii]
MPRPGPVSGPGRGILPGTHVFRGHGGPVTNANLEEREQPVLTMLNGIWYKEMDRHSQHYERAEAWLQPAGSLLISFGTEKLNDRLKFAPQYNFQISGPNDALVTRAINGARGYRVNSESRKCTCHYFFDNDIPFVHAIAVIYILWNAQLTSCQAIAEPKPTRRATKSTYRLSILSIPLHSELKRILAISKVWMWKWGRWGELVWDWIWRWNHQ